MSSSCIMCNNHKTKHFVRVKIVLYAVFALFAVLGTLEATHHISRALDGSKGMFFALAALLAVALGYFVYVVAKGAEWLLRQNAHCTKCNKSLRRSEPTTSECH